MWSSWSPIFFLLKKPEWMISSPTISWARSWVNCWRPFLLCPKPTDYQVLPIPSNISLAILSSPVFLWVPHLRPSVHLKCTTIIIIIQGPLTVQAPNQGRPHPSQMDIRACCFLAYKVLRSLCTTGEVKVSRFGVNLPRLRISLIICHLTCHDTDSPAETRF